MTCIIGVCKLAYIYLNYHIQKNSPDDISRHLRCTNPFELSMMKIIQSFRSSPFDRDLMLHDG